MFGFRAPLSFLFLFLLAGPAPSQVTNKPYSLTRPRLTTPKAALPNLSSASLEDRRYLLYLYGRLNQPEMVEALAEQLLAENPADKQTLLSLATIHQDLNDPARSLKYARRLAELYPRDPEALYALATAYDLNGQKAETRETLRRLKESRFPTGPFPYERDLASSALDTGDWSRAIQSYQRVLEEPQLKPATEEEVRRSLDELYRLYLPQLGLEASSISLNSGATYRFNSEYSAPLNVSQRVGLKLERDEIELNNTPLVKHRWSNRTLAYAGLESKWFAQLRSKVWLGGDDQPAPFYGGQLAFSWRSSQELAVEYVSNEPAVDSLTLELLNGRQDRVSVFYNYQLNPATSLALRWDGRRFFVQDEELGRGYVATVNFERVVWRRAPEIRAGYRGLLAGYSQTSQNTGLIAPLVKHRATTEQQKEILNSLARANLDRHGLYLGIQNSVQKRLNYRLLGAADYSADLNSLEYEMAAGLSFFPRKSIELRLDADYNSSANTSDPDSDRLQFTLAMKYFF